MGTEVDSDNWYSSTSGETTASPKGKWIRIDDDIIMAEQNLIDTYTKVVVIKNHDTVSL